MGNNGAKNDDFSKNSNFNIHSHQQAMMNLNGNYANVHNLAFSPMVYQPKIQQTEFKAIHRTCSIYKPSINIVDLQTNLKIQFEYDSDNGSKLQIFIGVTHVEQQQQSKRTLKINSQIFFEEYLVAGKKVKFQRTYPLNGYHKIKGSNLIFRIHNPSSNQSTQYSLRNMGSSHWKILLQKLEINGFVTQLDNLYRGGGENDDCIICFTEKVNTFIEPCNHLCLCLQCCEQVRKSTNTCPVCRTNIKSFKKITTTTQVG